MPKYTTYELKLQGDADIIAFVKEHAPKTFPTIKEANAARRAVRELFDGAVECEVYSVRRVPARTVRRKLRI